jgi:carboxylesterase
VKLADRFTAARRRYIVFEGEGAGRLTGEGDPHAIAVSGRPGARAILAFHGFAGTPNEVRPIVDVAGRVGWSARAPRLAGHAATAATLLDVGWREWSHEAAEALRELRVLSGGPVVVCGVSLGSLVATHLAATFPDEVAGLVALSNAIALRFWRIALPLAALERFRPFDNRFFVRKQGADISDPIARDKHLTYDVNPIAGAIEVVRAGRLVRAELANVRCPTLVMHGLEDRVCPVANAQRFADGLGTTDVQVVILPRSGHILSVDRDRSQVAACVEAFLGRLATR